MLNLPSQQNMEQDDTSNTAHHSQELEKRLKSIGCWGNVDEVASSLLKQQKKRELETAAKEIKARKESRTNPRFKTKKAARTLHTSLLHPREIAYHFERFSGLKLSKGCLPVLVDAFQRFTNLYIKQLKNNDVGHAFCLADVKKIMQQFGFIPAKDFKNRELYYLLREILDPEDVRLLIPMSTLNGIAGASTLRRDIWDKPPNPRHRKNKK